MRTRTEQGMRAPQRRAYGIASPDGSPGMHRFLWDMRVNGPSGRPGPMALPGEYRVRLSIGDWSDSREFRVRMDPRVEADGVTRDDLRAQFDFNMRVAGLSAEAAEFAEAVADAAGSGRYSGQDQQELEAIQALLVDAGGSYPQPMLLNQIRYLQGMTSRADQRPGNFAYTRFDELSQQLQELQTRFSRVTGGDR